MTTFNGRRPNARRTTLAEYASILLITLAANVGADETEMRLDVPSDEAQKKVSAVISEVYGSEYGKAVTDAEKARLTQKIMRDAVETKDESVARFVLFRIARDIACRQGDLASAFDAINWMGSEFAIDTLSMKLEAAHLAADAARAFSAREAISHSLNSLIAECIELERYDLAKSAVDIARSVASASRNSDQLAKLREKASFVDELIYESQIVNHAKSVLATDPGDPDANLKVGKYLCFFRGDWKRGLELLAIGSDEQLKAISLLELQEKEAMKIGDEWWSVAETCEGNAKKQVEKHAREWYRRALPKLSGFSRTKVEKRLATEPPAQDELNIADFKNWKGLDWHYEGKIAGTGLILTDVEFNLSELPKVTGTKRFTSYTRTKNSGSAEIFGSVASDRLEFNAGDSYTRRGKLVDGLLFVVWKNKDAAGESALAPKETAFQPSFIGTWQIFEDGKNVCDFELKPNGSAIKSNQKDMLGGWIASQSTVIIAWQNGWRDMFQVKGEGFRKMSFEPGKSILASPKKVGEAIKREP